MVAVAVVLEVEQVKEVAEEVAEEVVEAETRRQGGYLFHT